MAFALTDLVLRMRGDVSNFLGQMGTAERQLAFFGIRLRNLGTGLNAYVAVPMAALPTIVAVATAKMAMSFENAYAKIAALTDITRKEVEGLTPAIFDLSRQVGIMPQVLADALYFIASIGFRGEKSMEILTAGAKASAAGLGDLNNVVRVLTTVMYQYSDSGLTAAQAAAELVFAIREGNVEANGFVESIGRVLPVATELGVSFGQVAIAMAAMTRSGLDAYEAATAIRQIFVTLLGRSRQGAQALQEVGLSFGQLRKQLKEEGTIATLITLYNALKDNQEAFRQVFGNVRALTGFLNLMGESAEENVALFQRMGDVTEEELGRAFTEGTNRASFALEKLKANFGILAIELGNKFVPVILSASQSLLDMVNSIRTWYAALSPTMQALVTSVAAAAITFGAVHAATVLLSRAMMFAVGPIVKAVAAFIAAEGAAAGLTAAVGALGGWTTVVVGVLAAGAVLIYKHWDALQPLFQQVWDGLKTGFAAVTSYLEPAWTELTTFIIEQFGKVTGAVVAAVPAWKVALSDFWTWIKTTFGPLMSSLGDLLSVAWQGVEDAVVAVWTVIKTVLTVAIEGLTRVIGASAQVIQGNFRDAALVLINGYQAGADAANRLAAAQFPLIKSHKDIVTVTGSAAYVVDTMTGKIRALTGASRDAAPASDDLTAALRKQYDVMTADDLRKAMASQIHDIVALHQAGVPAEQLFDAFGDSIWELVEASETFHGDFQIPTDFQDLAYAAGPYGSAGALEGVVTLLSAKIPNAASTTKTALEQTFGKAETDAASALENGFTTGAQRGISSLSDQYNAWVQKVQSTPVTVPFTGSFPDMGGVVPQGV